MGMAYKKNIEDTRESASVKIFKGLLNYNTSLIYYCDPFVKQIFINNKIVKTLDYDKTNYKKFDLIIISTDHDKFNYKKILSSNKTIIDLRGRLNSLQHKKNVILL